VPEATELLRLYSDTEADNVERKRNFKDKDKIRQTICAFANDLSGKGGGVLFIGQEDDGTCAGLTVDDELLKTLGALRSDGVILPFPVLRVHKAELDGCTVAVVEVEASDNPPLRCDGRIWVRVCPRLAQATAEEERRLTEKRRWGNLPFDQHGVPGADMTDLNLIRFREEYLPSIIPLDVLEENHRDPQEQMRALRLVNRDGLPTNLAILVLGIEPRGWLPGAYIQFIRYAGTDMDAPVVDQKDIGGTVPDQARTIQEVLTAHTRTALDPNAAVSQPFPDYPLIALQEIVRNALIHRTYEGTAAPVRVTWYDDRIEIQNPGGPYGQVTRENFGKPGAADYRNPNLAEAMKALGFVHKFGSGLERARSALARNGNPHFELTVEASHLLVSLRPRP
jgi:ATP-dependent DNA helicase RecG